MPAPQDHTIKSETPARWMTRRYVLALALIALLALSAFLFFQQGVDQSLKVSEAINVAGKQRALSQATALSLHELAETNRRIMAGDGDTPTNQQRRADLIEDLTRNLDLMEQNHTALSSGKVGFAANGALPDNLRAIYFSAPFYLDRQTRAYIADARAVLSLPPSNQTLNDPAVRTLIEARANRLLQSLDLAVAVYTREGTNATEAIRFIQIVLLLTILATLLLEAVLIFRPMVARVDSEIAENYQISAELRAARDGLEDEVKRRTADLEVAREEAVRANIAKSRFLAHASHDLSQPLEAMNLFVGALERQTDNPKMRAITHDLRQAQRSMRQLLAALLDISQIEAGVIVAKPERLKLAVLFDQLEAEYDPIAAERGLSLQVVPTHWEVMVDRMLLERILRNLMTNAIRYTEEGGVLVGCRLEDGHVRIEVHDTGPGIPDDQREKIFEEFHQLDIKGRDKSEGLGLGLTIARRMAGLIGGKLTVRSRPGAGSIFAITVPRVDAG